jgi:hypothetical protein
MLRRSLHEHEPPQATVEPAAPVAVPGPAAPTGLVGMPALTVSLQRSLGNRMVARALRQIARDEDTDLDVAGEAIPLEDPLQQPPSGGAAAPTPTFDHSGGSTVTVNADTAVEFSNQIVATIGAPHVSPEFQPQIDFDFKVDAAGNEVPGTKTIKSIGLNVKTAITKVRWGMGRADDENKAMIKRMVAEIQAHEEAHRKIIESAATTALAGAQKFVGTKKIAEARAALTTGLECTTNKGHEALDGTEGKLTVSEVRQPDGTIKLELGKSSSGAKYPCKK